MFCFLIAPRIDIKYSEVNRKEEQQSRDKIDDIHKLLFSNGRSRGRGRHSISNNNNNNNNIMNGLNSNVDEEDMKISTLNYNDTVMNDGNDDHYYNYHGRGNDNDIPQTPIIHRRGNGHIHDNIDNDDHDDDHDDDDKDPTYNNIVQMIYAFFDVNTQ